MWLRIWLVIYMLDTDIIDRFFNWIGGLSFVGGGLVAANSGHVTMNEILGDLFNFTLSAPNAIMLVSLIGGVLFITEKVILIRIRRLEEKILNAKDADTKKKDDEN